MATEKRTPHHFARPWSAFIAHGLPGAEACRVGDPLGSVVMTSRPTSWRAQTGTHAHTAVPRHAALGGWPRCGSRRGPSSPSTPASPARRRTRPRPSRGGAGGAGRRGAARRHRPRGAAAGRGPCPPRGDGAGSGDGVVPGAAVPRRGGRRPDRQSRRRPGSGRHRCGQGRAARRGGVPARALHVTGTVWTPWTRTPRPSRPASRPSGCAVRAAPGPASSLCGETQQSLQWGGSTRSIPSPTLGGV